MMYILIADAVVLVVLLGMSAFFSSAETAFFSLNPIQIHGIRRRKPKAARRIEQYLAAPTQVLSTILIGNTLVNITAANLGFLIANTLAPGHGESISVPVMTVLLLMFGEVAPKRLAVRRPDQLAVLFIPVIDFIVRACAPARLLLEWITQSFEKHYQRRSTSMTEDEFRTAVGVSQEEGILNTDERAMVDGIIRLENVRAADIMTPRVDLVGIDIDAPVAESLTVARQARLRYLPVYRGSFDRIEGFLDVFRFLMDPAHDTRAAMLHHFYVPDTAPLDSLLTMFQRENLRLAIVVDEYGGTAGLITRGDILEEIVQDIQSEYGRGGLRIEEQGRNRWIVDGTVSLEDVNYQLGLKLEAEAADRVAGWVSEQTGRLPKTGEVIEGQGCRATVIEVKKHRIRTVLLERM